MCRRDENEKHYEDKKLRKKTIALADDNKDSRTGIRESTDEINKIKCPNGVTKNMKIQC